MFVFCLFYYICIDFSQFHFMRKKINKHQTKSIITCAQSHCLYQNNKICLIQRKSKEQIRIDKSETLVTLPSLLRNKLSVPDNTNERTNYLKNLGSVNRCVQLVIFCYTAHATCPECLQHLQSRCMHVQFKVLDSMCVGCWITSE